jgi:anti-sigma factor ChrR (cupin superfamily)
VSGRTSSGSRCNAGPGQWTQQGGQQRPVGGLEPDALVAELALQHAQLVSQHKDLRVLVPITTRQQA